MNTKPVIPIFYACDDRFIPFAMVSLTSILENADPERQYEVHILHTDISSARMEQVRRKPTGNTINLWRYAQWLLQAISETD